MKRRSFLAALGLALPSVAIAKTTPKVKIQTKPGDIICVQEFPNGLQQCGRRLATYRVIDTEGNVEQINT